MERTTNLKYRTQDETEAALETALRAICPDVDLEPSDYALGFILRHMPNGIKVPFATVYVNQKDLITVYRAIYDSWKGILLDEELIAENLTITQAISAIEELREGIYPPHSSKEIERIIKANIDRYNLNAGSVINGQLKQ